MDISRLADKLRSQNFSPNDSVILSAINHPLTAAQKGADWFAGQVNRAANIPEQYDNPNPLAGYTPEQQVGGALNLAGLLQTSAFPFAPKGAGTLGTIKASHGSPHKFESFDLSKIGTGEGAQAYGHGAYFGEGYGSPVAMKYVPRNEKLDDKLLALHDMAERRQQYPAMEVYEQYMLNRTPEEIEKHFADELPNYTKAEQAQILNAQKTAKDAYQKQKGSYLYDVDIKWPDPAREAADPLGKHHLLDWDAPLSEQSDYVKNIVEGNPWLKNKLTENEKWLKEMHQKFASKEIQDDFSKIRPITGESIYTSAQAVKANPFGFTENGPKEASEYLKELGIPGLKYLDQGSRGAGEGSHNIVMFGDEYPQIVSINSKEIAKKLRGK